MKIIIQIGSAVARQHNVNMQQFSNTLGRDDY